MTPAGCGCKIVEVLAGDFCEENPPTIEFCPLHQNAGKMLEFLKEMKDHGGPLTPLGHEQLDSLITKASRREERGTKC